MRLKSLKIYIHWFKKRDSKYSKTTKILGYWKYVVSRRGIYYGNENSILIDILTEAL